MRDDDKNESESIKNRRREKRVIVKILARCCDFSLLFFLFVHLCYTFKQHLFKPCLVLLLGLHRIPRRQR